MMKISVILPARNEAASLAELLPAIRCLLPEAEVIVVSDGSTDRTAAIAIENRACLVEHPYPKGNGAAIKSGSRRASGDVLVFMDADGQHLPKDILRLVEKLASGYDMVVGSRDSEGQASRHRGLANAFYNRLASWMVGHEIKDLTSGFRVVKRDKFLEFLYLLPNGFSYPTTSTMAFFRAGYAVAYEPITVQSRMAGTESHVRLWRDGVRFLLIIFKIGTLFSPLKLFLPISLSFFLTGLGYYTYTYMSSGRFTNMSALLFMNSVLIFLIGLVSEQLTQLTYMHARDSENNQDRVG